MTDEATATPAPEAIASGLDALAVLAGLELPDACREGVLANLALLEGHLRALRGIGRSGSAL